jgi:hypothetical protein
VGNWEISPIYTFESGEWATVQSGVDANMNGDSAGDRAIVNRGGVKGTGTPVHTLCNSSFLTSAYYTTVVGQGDTPVCGGAVTIPDPLDATKTITYKSNQYVVAYAANNPNAYYIQAQQGALATDGRNSFLTKPINNIDLTLMKRINVTERWRVEFAMQALNALNHPQFVLNRINDILSGGTTDSSVQNMLKPQATNFNHPEKVLPSNARSLQLYLKVIF